jgi:hypothetical protein
MKNAKVIKTSAKGNCELQDNLSSPITAGSNNDHSLNRLQSTSGLVLKVCFLSLLLNLSIDVYIIGFSSFLNRMAANPSPTNCQQSRHVGLGVVKRHQLDGM